MEIDIDQGGNYITRYLCNIPLCLFSFSYINSTCF